MTRSFPVAYAEGTRPEVLARELASRLTDLPRGEHLGFLYCSDALARDLEPLLEQLRVATGVSHWVGSVGVAISLTGREVYDTPAVCAMVGAFPEGSFRVFPTLELDCARLTRVLQEWPARNAVRLGIIHGDPSNSQTPALVAHSGETAGAFMVGGLTSSQSMNLQIADGVTQGGVSGVLFSDAVQVVTSHTQGCAPIGPKHLITHASRNILAQLDGRPALDVFEEDIGEVLARDLSRVGGYIFAGLPIPESDTGDYMVRNLLGVDTGQRLIAVGDYLREGAEVMFCRRDGNTAREDMRRMLEDLKHRVGHRPRGGVYYSCLGRGRHQFGDDSEELRMIGEVLGDIPLVGFFANGEIFHNRLYGYTGVLTLFL